MIHNNPNYTIESINMSYKAIINLFKEQEITIGIINIEDYYKNICYLLKHYGIELPTNPTITDIIDICKRYNTKLTHKTGKLYYIHPSLKERDNTYTLKNELEEICCKINYELHTNMREFYGYKHIDIPKLNAIRYSVTDREPVMLQSKVKLPPIHINYNEEIFKNGLLLDFARSEDFKSLVKFEKKYRL